LRQQLSLRCCVPAILRIVTIASLLCASLTPSWADDLPPGHAANTTAGEVAVDDQLAVRSSAQSRLLQLGPGDSVAIQVYGQPEMNGTLTVSDDGSLPVALVGDVQVRGLSPAEAGKRIEKTLRDRRILLDPHVTISVVQSRSQRVSVLGEVRAPGRYPVESNTTVFDLLAQAGGTTENSADVIYIYTPNGNGSASKVEINLRESADTLTSRTLHSGDSLFVPRAEHFYIYGEVQQPNMYKVEPHMTVNQAIARAGGVTARGTDKRVEIKRHGKNGDYVTISISPSTLVQPDDVIRVKESIF
jgi:polysaccharide export outer membrane protein